MYVTYRYAKYLQTYYIYLPTYISNTNNICNLPSFEQMKVILTIEEICIILIQSITIATKIDFGLSGCFHRKWQHFYCIFRSLKNNKKTLLLSKKKSDIFENLRLFSINGSKKKILLTYVNIFFKFFLKIKINHLVRQMSFNKCLLRQMCF